MNTLKEQSSAQVPDAHWHLCESCGAAFTHVKSLIPPGGGHAAHACPACGKHVNSPQRLMSESIDAVPVFEDWYGLGVKVAKDLPKRKKRKAR